MSRWVKQELVRLVEAVHFDSPKEGEVALGHDAVLTKCLACGVIHRKMEEALETAVRQMDAYMKGERKTW